ncbi:MAG: nickel pincer cofactor biosynthesis protein LarB [Candidatus Sumerlaeaceae bacterium]|nr:nickel pincer cofactor biosynthesis protein LarB [Candidatus Sumerlaeaceae bacterium]
MSSLKEILEAVAGGRLSAVQGERAIAEQAGYASLGHAKVDLARRKRRGVAEAVFAAGKTPQQVLEIASRLDAAGQNVLCTRVDAAMAKWIRRKRPDFAYHEQARALVKQNEIFKNPAGLVLVLSAGTSDIPVAEEAALSAELMGSRVDRIYDVGVAGIHRLLGSAAEKMAEARVIIVAAGMEGALPSVVAGLVSAPVVAVPTSVGYGASLGGITALLAMLNSCSGGVGVMNIDNGFGAGLLAHMINVLPDRVAGAKSPTPANKNAKGSRKKK